MCGIVCCIQKKKNISNKELENSIKKIQYRGIDASGTYFSKDGKVFLGHTRLSIIDVSEASNQPMYSENSRYILIFNGEIYNYVELKNELINNGCKFVTESDSEVIINGFIYWGDNIFSKLNGPFAIVIYDTVENKIWVARDRAGEKPLFYFKNANGVSFSSDMSVVVDLLKIKKTLSIEGLQSYLIHGYATDDMNLIDGVKSIKPGTFNIIDCNDLVSREVNYWPISKVYENDLLPINYIDIVNRIDKLLLEAVKRQLRSDVPIAVMLSGGVDSSLITAYAAESIDKLNTFTVSFPGDSKFDESASAKKIADHFKTNHTVIDGSEISPEILIEIVAKLDTPIIDSSLLPTYILYKSVSKKYKVALGGDGADELFGGYKHYSRMLKLGNYTPFSEIAINSLSKIKFFDTNKQLKFSNWSILLNKLKNGSTANVRRFISDAKLTEILKDNCSFSSINTVNDKWTKQCMNIYNNHSNKKSKVDRLMTSDFATYLRNSILVKSDRCSMMNSVEVRAPFLDIKIIDFAFNNLDSNLKVSEKHRKIILKELCKKRLPPSFDLNRKLGFNLPFGNLIRNGVWKEFVNDIIFTNLNFISLDARKIIMKEHMNGIDNSDIIFGIVLLILWCKKEGIVL